MLAAPTEPTAAVGLLAKTLGKAPEPRSAVVRSIARMRQLLRFQPSARASRRCASSASDRRTPSDHVDQTFVPGRDRTRPCARLPLCRPACAPDQKWRLFAAKPLPRADGFASAHYPAKTRTSCNAGPTCARSGGDPASGLDLRLDDQPTSHPFFAPFGGDLLLVFDSDPARAVPGGVDLCTGACRGVESLGSDTLRRNDNSLDLENEFPLFPVISTGVVLQIKTPWI